MVEFPNGTLEMSSSPFLIAGEDALWSQGPLISILILCSAVIFLVLVKDFLAFFPYGLDALTRSKANYTVISSLAMIRCRRMACLSMVVPLALSFIYFFPRAGAIGIAFFSFLAYEGLLGAVPWHPKVSAGDWKAAQGSLLTYFVPYACVVIVTACVSAFFHSSTVIFRDIIRGESAFFIILYIIRKWQILSKACRFLPSFLYLCALDFAPLGLIIVSVR